MTKGQEAAARGWLHRLGFSIPSAEQHGATHFLEDPLRNGVLLCDLVMLLDADCTLDGGVHRRPATIGAARDNLRRALQQLRQLRQAQVPACYLWDAEGACNALAPPAPALLLLVLLSTCKPS